MSNRALVQRMTEAFLKGDIAAMQAFWAEDIIWQFPGHSVIAGVFRGKEAVLKYKDHEKTINTSEVDYMQRRHIPLYGEKGSEFLEVSPKADLEKTMAVIQENMKQLQAQQPT